MAALKLELADYKDRDVTWGKPKKMLTSLKSKFVTEPTAYRTVGTTDFNEARIFDILNDFLQPDSKKTLDATVKALLAFIPDEAQDSTEVATLGDLLIELAEQIPYNHPAQIKLLRVLESLRETKKFTITDNEGTMLSCTRLGESMRDNYSGPDEEEPRAWLNLTAFFANENSLHIRWRHPLYAIWAMRAAFETPPDQYEHSFDGMQVLYIIAAAQHVIWNGQEIFKHFIYSPEADDDELRCWKPGSLYPGGNGITMQRWRFWRDGFRAAKDNTDFSEECRKAATKAWKLMEVIEETMTCE